MGLRPMSLSLSSARKEIKVGDKDNCPTVPLSSGRNQTGAPVAIQQSRTLPIGKSHLYSYPKNLKARISIYTEIFTFQKSYYKKCYSPFFLYDYTFLIRKISEQN